jgi:hypothetical protein
MNSVRQCKASQALCLRHLIDQGCAAESSLLGGRGNNALNKAEGWRGARTTHDGTEVVHGGRDEAAHNNKATKCIIRRNNKGSCKGGLERCTIGGARGCGRCGEGTWEEGSAARRCQTPDADRPHHPRRTDVRPGKTHPNDPRRAPWTGSRPNPRAGRRSMQEAYYKNKNKHWLVGSHIEETTGATDALRGGTRDKPPHALTSIGCTPTHTTKKSRPCQSHFHAQSISTHPPYVSLNTVRTCARGAIQQKKRDKLAAMPRDSQSDKTTQHRDNHSYQSAPLKSHGDNKQFAQDLTNIYLAKLTLETQQPPRR